MGLRSDGPGRRLCLCRRHRFFRHKLDRTGGPGCRTSELATALLVPNEGIEVIELLLADATNVDVGGELHQHGGAAGNCGKHQQGQQLVFEKTGTGEAPLTDTPTSR